MANEIIVVESGATKSDWRVLSPSGREIRRFDRRGTNVSTMSMDQVNMILTEAITSEGLTDISAFYLYTAGVVSSEIYAELERNLKNISGASDVDIQNDLMGAARGVCGSHPGIVAIMGTGSNTCFYDGCSIVQNVYSGGYILGDDGSAAALGRLFLSDFIKGLVPDSIASDFSQKYDSSYVSIVENVYRSSSPSGFLGSLAPFILSHYSHPYIKSLVEKNFQAFIDRSLKQYDVEKYPVGIVGGFGWACRDIFAQLCESSGIKVSRFVKAPIEGLCEYHGR